MTSPDRSFRVTPELLTHLLRTAVQEGVRQATTKTRTPTLLPGVVEQLDDDGDVVWVRMDAEAMGSDPTQSMNYGEPGVLPATRNGQTTDGDLVRVDFDAQYGATASQTGADLRFHKGLIFDEAGNWVGILSPDLWAVGDLDTAGRRVTIDPIGGIRFRDANDVLVGTLTEGGYSLRSGSSGLVTAEIANGMFRLVDPNGTDDIEMVTDAGGTLPNPVFTTAAEVNPSSSLVAPTAPVFTSTPADDLELAHVSAWLAGTSQSATMTPPAGWTEQHDESHSTGTTGTIHHSTGSRWPATGTSGTFTSTLSNWQHAVGCHVVIKGGGAASPSVRALASSSYATSTSKATITVNKPTGTADGDALVVIVDLGVNGGFVPTGWTIPQGFVPLGYGVSTSGSGTSQTTLATGIWVKRCGASEPANYSATINLPTGAKLITTTAIAVQNPFLVPGGVQIRLAGKPIRRLLAYTELQAINGTLCDFTNIPAGYDNLELVMDGISAAGSTSGAVERAIMRFNNDSTAADYFWRALQDGAAASGSPSYAATGYIRVGAINGAAAGSRLTGNVNIYGYVSQAKPVNIGRYWWGEGNALTIHEGTWAGEWEGSGGNSKIDRITVLSNNSANARFGVGSRAYLYGY